MSATAQRILSSTQTRDLAVSSSQYPTQTLASGAGLRVLSSLPPCSALSMCAGTLGDKHPY